MVGSRNIGSRNLVGLLGVATILCIGACEKSEGPLEKAGKAIDETAEDAGDKMREVGDDMKNMVDGD